MWICSMEKCLILFHFHCLGSLSQKTEKFQILKVIKILWYFLIKKDKLSDLYMSYGKMSDFVSFPLFGFTLVKKMKNFDFESH